MTSDNVNMDMRELPFLVFDADQNVTSYWVPARPGSDDPMRYRDEETAIGHEWGAYMIWLLKGHPTEGPSLLCEVVKGMADLGHFGARESSFLYALGQCVANGRLRMDAVLEAVLAAPPWSWEDRSINSTRREPMTDDELSAAFRKVVDHYWSDEKRHHQANSGPDHIFHALEVLRRQVNRE